jgi:SAM-dependent methyltransferase
MTASAPPPDARTRFLAQLRAALTTGTLVKLTLGKPLPPAAPSTLRNLYVRPVTLKAGPHFAFLWRHVTNDITKNHPPAESLAELEALLGTTFGDAHLFTPLQSHQLQTLPDGRVKLISRAATSAPPPPPEGNDHAKVHPVAATAPWLHAIGVTNPHGQPREGMAGKFRQIQKFAELLTHLLIEAGLRPAVAADDSSYPPFAGSVPEILRIADMGCGKGYLTFATAALLGDKAEVTGIERRPELVAECNRLATAHGFAPRLRFVAGDIPAPFGISDSSSSSPATPAESAIEHSSWDIRQVSASRGAADAPLDALIALHACDTATDDALAAGIAAGARLLVVSPCCHREIRAQLTAPPVLHDALRHGILHEREAEIITDALRAQLLEYQGYRTKVFEFISPEHTSKNLMISAVREHAPDSAELARRRPALAARIRAYAAFFGLHEQRLARHLGFVLNA